jgi:hypothetical protein
MILSLYFFIYIPVGPSSPSSHEMRDNPFLGQYTQKYQKIRRQGDEMWKVVSMIGNGTMNFQQNIPVANPSLRMTTY